LIVIKDQRDVEVKIVLEIKAQTLKRKLE